MYQAYAHTCDLLACTCDFLTCTFFKFAIACYLWLQCNRTKILPCYQRQENLFVSIAVLTDLPDMLLQTTATS